MKFQDLTGQHFGKLTVMERAENKGRATRWLCRCDCGKLITVYASNLKRGFTTSCAGVGHNAIDLTDKRFGRLVVMRQDNGKSTPGNIYWLCKCDCGKVVSVRSDSLTSGATQSCGCLQREAASEVGKNTATHHKTKTRLYGVWQGIKRRVYNPHCSKYSVYSGRGVTMCEEWRNSFTAFEEWALANGYDEAAPYGKCTIDRIDVNGNYEPSNCRWVDLKVQANNKRGTKHGTAIF